MIVVQSFPYDSCADLYMVWRLIGAAAASYFMSSDSMSAVAPPFMCLGEGENGAYMHKSALPKGLHSRAAGYSYVYIVVPM